ncbi:hypothetical protein SPI_08761 [Niveomyces insectorum RCEF 264]|uniref:Uncharacterized protein n=1 Tax=Niveomyces insectorum RCEF 264 TaxID=1081102 RepID=A0A162IAS8_9HYPO|nr:hypothetical protein SPI_08761 [Niveomyces insectorum RCEF 264]
MRRPTRSTTLLCRRHGRVGSGASRRLAGVDIDPEEYRLRLEPRDRLYDLWFFSLFNEAHQSVTTYLRVLPSPVGGLLLRESVVILCIPVPNAAIESLQEPRILRVFWPSPEWKELIWTCRTSRDLPSHLRQFERATVIIGTSSRRPNRAFENMKSYLEVGEKYVLRVGQQGEGRPAVQYAFAGREHGKNFLLRNGARNLKLFSFAHDDLEEWLAAFPSQN